MARIVPSDIARLELAGANRHEIETLRLLQARLPDDYTVFHGVHWTREWPGETVFGELDFVVVNRAGKALLIEQKDGTLEETGTTRPRSSLAWSPRSSATSWAMVSLTARSWCS